MIQHIPVHVLEAKYGMVLQQETQLTCEQLLGAYGVLRWVNYSTFEIYEIARGFMTSGGRPDQARAARLLLKDYVAGRWISATSHCLTAQLFYRTHLMFDLGNDGNKIQNRLLYCEAPPGADQSTFHTHPFEVEDLKK